MQVFICPKNTAVLCFAVYSRCLLDDWRVSCIITDAIIDEISELIQLNPATFEPSARDAIDNLRTEALKALASVIFLDKPNK